MGVDQIKKMIKIRKGKIAKSPEEQLKMEKKRFKEKKLRHKSVVANHARGNDDQRKLDQFPTKKW